MTDNEIIVALDGSILNAKSVDCKVWSLEVYKLENALNLINRQKAEIERLEKEIKDKEKVYNDEFCLRKEWQTKCRESHKEKQITKSEAIEEFAERLKSKIWHSPEYNYINSITPDYIDNLVKEMTEEIEK